MIVYSAILWTLLIDPAVTAVCLTFSILASGFAVRSRFGAGCAELPLSVVLCGAGAALMLYATGYGAAVSIISGIQVIELATANVENLLQQRMIESWQINKATAERDAEVAKQQRSEEIKQEAPQSAREDTVSAAQEDLMRSYQSDLAAAIQESQAEAKRRVAARAAESKRE